MCQVVTFVYKILHASFMFVNESSLPPTAFFPTRNKNLFWLVLFWSFMGNSLLVLMIITLINEWMNK